MKRYIIFLLSLHFISTSFLASSNDSELTRRVSSNRIQIAHQRPNENTQQRRINSPESQNADSCCSCTKVCLVIMSCITLGTIGYTVWRQETIADKLVDKLPNLNTIQSIIPTIPQLTLPEIDISALPSLDSSSSSTESNDVSQPLIETSEIHDSETTDSTSTSSQNSLTLPPLPSLI